MSKPAFLRRVSCYNESLSKDERRRAAWNSRTPSPAVGRILRILLGLFFFLLLIVSLLPLGSGVVNIGVAVPAAAAVCGLFGCVCTGRLRGILTYIGKRKGLRIAMGILLGIVGALLILFLAVSGLMLAGAARPAPENATVIVLGAGLHDGKPSRMLADRLNAAARYLEANPESVCIVSGGQGRTSPGPRRRR